ncbi:hypothetical protein [Sporosarcina sp. 6E9]|uniref:hypothetical protein n=1 Tax=Sporosarcina sp. 6E9 TaxID=2819235 RepID=UPI001B304A40|nr:hypothetical protein [Sporosarcina sp. 6E9]
MERNSKVASILALIGGVISILWTLFGLIWMLLMGESDSVLLLIWGVGAVFQFAFAIIAILLSIRIKKKATKLQGIILLVMGITTIIFQFFISILFIIAGIFVLMPDKNEVK